MSRHEALACAVLQMVIVQKNPAVGLIVHSDRGMQLRFKELSQHQLPEPLNSAKAYLDFAIRLASAKVPE